MGDLIDWKHIVSLGAAAPPRFADPQREFDAARTGTVVVPVTQFGLLRFHGSDAQSFLQGQLTCDVDRVTPEQAQLGGYCTPQGRLLANFLLVSVAEGYLMYLAADVAASVAARLRKFILRSDVKIEHETDLRILGLAGPAAPGLLQQVLTVPRHNLATALDARASVMELPGRNFLVIAAAGDMAAVWDDLAGPAVPAGTECWDWIQIRAGLPWITTATQDQFLPQMIGLDTIGGVSFDKGCYTGQEIVARTHYRGDVKRNLRFGRSRAMMGAGDVIRAAGKPCGIVLNAAPVPGAGWELLAVVSDQTDAEVQNARGDPIELAPSSVPA